MKNLLFSILLLVSFSSCIPTRKAITVDSPAPLKIETTLTKTEAYACIREWYVDAFRSSNDVIQMDDKDIGIIAAKFDDEFYYLSFNEVARGTIRFTIKTKMRDNLVTFQVIHNEKVYLEEAKKIQEVTNGLQLYFLENLKQCQND